MSLICVYVLKLEHGKYYVGGASNPDRKIRSHFSGDGCEWTKIHRPLDLLLIIENVPFNDLDNIVKYYMGIYGSYNVRGGAMSAIYLPEHKFKSIDAFLEDEIDHCPRCAIMGHPPRFCLERAPEPPAPTFRYNRQTTKYPCDIPPSLRKERARLFS